MVVFEFCVMFFFLFFLLICIEGKLSVSDSDGYKHYIGDTVRFWVFLCIIDYYGFAWVKSHDVTQIMLLFHVRLHVRVGRSFFILGLLTFFASRLFLKGTLCCVITRNYKQRSAI